MCLNYKEKKEGKKGSDKGVISFFLYLLVINNKTENYVHYHHMCLDSK